MNNTERRGAERERGANEVGRKCHGLPFCPSVASGSNIGSPFLFCSPGVVSPFSVRGLAEKKGAPRATD